MLIAGELADPFTELESIHSRELHIEEDEIERICLSQLDGLLWAAGSDRFELGLFKGVCHRAAGKYFVVHNQDAV